MNLQQPLAGGKGSLICQIRKPRFRRGQPEVSVPLAQHPFPSLCFLFPCCHKASLSLMEAGIEETAGLGLEPRMPGLVLRSVHLFLNGDFEVPT